MKFKIIRPYIQKTNYIVKYLACICIAAIAGCNNPENSGSSTPQKPAVDLCKCLLEPGDSEYMIQNKQACDEAISREVGVDDWTKGMTDNDHQKMNALILTCKMKK